jgi:hypothetical protein
MFSGIFNARAAQINSATGAPNFISFWETNVAFNGAIGFDAGSQNMVFQTGGSGILNGTTRMTIAANGNIGVGTSAPTAKLDVNGTINATAINVNGTAVNGSQWATSGSTINYASGNVGIGTTTPGTINGVNFGSNVAFHLKGTGASKYLAVDDANAVGVLLNDSSQAANSRMWALLNQSNRFSVSTFTDAGAPTEALSVLRSGNVGIGVSNPTDKLHLNGNVTNGAGLTIDNSGTSKYRIGTLATTIPNWTGEFMNTKYNQAAGNWTLDDPSLNAAFFKFDLRPIGNEIGFYRMLAGSNPRPDTAWTSLMQMRLDTGNIYLAPSGGNVGIGTSSPTVKLDVNGTVNATGLTVNGAAVTGSQWATSGTAINYGTGNVGIGTASPTAKLDVNGTVNATGLTVNGAAVTGSQWATSGTAINYGTGNVGIGTSAPSSKLHVVGDGRVTGNLTVDGNIAAKYQDVAEWVNSSQALTSGTVVVLDQTRSNQVIASSQSYDTRVAGVISEQPGIALGEGGAGKVLVATTGRVRIKVDASNGAIHIGDLLVTSDKEGVAMKSQPINIGGAQIHRPGTLIGKALESLENGTGEMLVLLSLQ